MTDKKVVLNALQVEQKIQRIAHQLHESNFAESSIILVGIAGRGYTLATRIALTLEKIAHFSVRLVELKLDKDAPLEGKVQFDITKEEVADQNIILIDDVLNSGKTLMYATRHILQANIKKLNTVVLVDRKHRRFPIRADYAGLTLSTTLEEHIAVEFGTDPAHDEVILR